MVTIILSKLVTDHLGLFSLHIRRSSLLSRCADQLRGNIYMNKGDKNVRCLSQFKDSYGKLRDELGFFQASC